MTGKEKTRRSDCPINFSLELFGDRWTLLVIRDLVFNGKKHFREILASTEKISTNILADRLKRLEENGIISRQTAPDSGREVIYRLTEKGSDLIPILLEMTRWGAKYDKHTGAPASFIKLIEAERERLTEELKSGDFNMEGNED